MNSIKFFHINVIQLYFSKYPLKYTAIWKIPLKIKALSDAFLSSFVNWSSINFFAYISTRLTHILLTMVSVYSMSLSSETSLIFLASFSRSRKKFCCCEFHRKSDKNRGEKFQFVAKSKLKFKTQSVL